MRVCGTDPGRKGCCVVLCEGSSIGWYFKLKYNAAGHLHYHLLNKFLEQCSPDLIVLEKVQGRGGMGATATFSFGFGCGELNATLRMYADRNATVMHYINPQSWQKVIHEGSPAKLTPKARSQLAYERLFPHKPLTVSPRAKKLDDNVVDALLLATYGILKLGSGGLKKWTLTELNGED